MAEFKKHMMYGDGKSKMANTKSNTNKKIKLRSNYYYVDSWFKKILRNALSFFK